MVCYFCTSTTNSIYYIQNSIVTSYCMLGLNLIFGHCIAENIGKLLGNQSLLP